MSPAPKKAPIVTLDPIADTAFVATSGWTDSVRTWLNGQRFTRVYRKDGYSRLDSLGTSSTAAIDWYNQRWFYNSTTGMVDSVGVGSRRVKFGYDADGQRTTTDWGAGVTRTESWTTRHAPSRASFSTSVAHDAFSRDFGYDAQGRISLERRYLSGGDIELDRWFEYTRIGELRHVDRDSAWYAYDCYIDVDGREVCDRYREARRVKDLGLFYDGASNLQQQVDSLGSVTTTATIDPGNRLRQWDGMAYGYDRDGNLVSRIAGSDTTRFGWDATGQLRWAALRSDTTYYDYDAGGQLVRRRKPGGVIDRWYLWDGGQLVAELCNELHDRQFRWGRPQSRFPDRRQPCGCLYHENNGDGDACRRVGRTTLNRRNKRWPSGSSRNAEIRGSVEW